jgi:hypothetical protein
MAAFPNQELIAQDGLFVGAGDPLQGTYAHPFGQKVNDVIPGLGINDSRHKQPRLSLFSLLAAMAHVAHICREKGV